MNTETPLALGAFNEARFENTLKFDELVDRHYTPLYRFAFSLTRSEPDAADLTQQTFYIWATKGNQLRDPAKVKTWLFTTLHRAFLFRHRQQLRFPSCELSDAESELPVTLPETTSQLDREQLWHALARLDEGYQAAVSLFYLDDLSYNEIAQVLGVPLGTVKSRIARGLIKLYEMLSIGSFARTN